MGATSFQCSKGKAVVVKRFTTKFSELQALCANSVVTVADTGLAVQTKLKANLKTKTRNLSKNLEEGSKELETIFSDHLHAIRPQIWEEHQNSLGSAVMERSESGEHNTEESADSSHEETAYADLGLTGDLINIKGVVQTSITTPLKNTIYTLSNDIYVALEESLKSMPSKQSFKPMAPKDSNLPAAQGCMEFNDHLEAALQTQLESKKNECASGGAQLCNNLREFFTKIAMDIKKVKQDQFSETKVSEMKIACKNSITEENGYIAGVVDYFGSTLGATKLFNATNIIKKQTLPMDVCETFIDKMVSETQSTLDSLINLSQFTHKFCPTSTQTTTEDINVNVAGEDSAPASGDEL